MAGNHDRTLFRIKVLLATRPKEDVFCSDKQVVTPKVKARRRSPARLLAPVILFCSINIRVREDPLINLSPSFRRAFSVFLDVPRGAHETRQARVAPSRNVIMNRR